MQRDDSCRGGPFKHDGIRIIVIDDVMKERDESENPDPSQSM